MSLETLINKFSHKDIDYTLLGCVLGDGSLTGASNWIRIKHTNKQREYVEFKEALFQKLGLTTKSRYDFTVKTNLGAYEYSEVNVKPKSLGRIKGKSLEYMLKRITPLGLLLWWLDDGCLMVIPDVEDKSVRRFGYLNTQAFDYQQHLLLLKLFKDLFGLDLRIHKDVGGIKDSKKVYYRLYFNATNLRKFIDIFYDYIQYIPNSMKYKLNMGYFKNRMLRSEEFMRYNF